MCPVLGIHFPLIKGKKDRSCLGILRKPARRFSVWLPGTKGEPQTGTSSTVPSPYGYPARSGGCDARADARIVVQQGGRDRSPRLQNKPSALSMPTYYVLASLPIRPRSCAEHTRKGVGGAGGRKERGGRARFFGGGDAKNENKRALAQRSVAHLHNKYSGGVHAAVSRGAESQADLVARQNVKKKL